jgi:hypothetical protein
MFMALMNFMACIFIGGILIAIPLHIFAALCRLFTSQGSH